MPTQFGQIVIGPPGSGKTTYCKVMSQMLRDIGRKVDIINLDPGNDTLPFTPLIDINKFQTVRQTMEIDEVGPNAALVLIMEYFKDHIEWFLRKMRNSPNNYFLIDFPGQVELYTHHSVVKEIMEVFTKEDIRLCSVFITDIHYANDPGKYLSSLLVALNSMVNLECPTVNVLSKIDSANKFGDLDFGLEFYTDVLDLDFVVELLDDQPFAKRFKSLSAAIADVVSRYGLVSFIPMSIVNRDSMQAVIKAVDKANGYIFGSGEERNMMRLLSTAVGAESEHDRIGSIKDSVMESDEDSEEEYMKMIMNPNAR